MFRISAAAAAALTFGLGTMTVSAQEVVDIEPIEIENRGGVPDYYPAPDGIHVIYQPRSQDTFLFLDNVHEGSRVQIPLPFEGENPVSVPAYNRSPFYSLRWAPDSTKFAFVGTDFRRLYEGDLWIYDLETETWTNATDDGYAGPAMQDVLMREEMIEGQPFSMEAQPSWSPDGRSIAFEQTIVTDNEASPTTISLLDVETGEIRELVEVPKSAPDARMLGTVVGLEWSPDGTTLYMSVFGVPRNAEIDGLYTLDVETGTLEKLLTPAQMDEVFIDFSRGTDDPPMFIVPMRISPTGGQLLMWVGDDVGFTELYWPFLYDLETETLTPVVAYEPADGEAIQQWIPQHVAWSPDGTQILSLSRTLVTGLDVPELLPIDGEPFLLGRYTIADGEFETLGQLPFFPAVPLMGEWGADGHVVLGGFRFTLE